MRSILFILAIIWIGNPIIAQNLAADFDGSSSIISAGGTAVDGAAGLTVGGWIYPRDAIGGFPGFDGFFGFRDNFGFDFYVLQLNGTDMEARFRNSIGTNFDIVSSSLMVNQWQHVALTYDGSQIAFYYNGVLEATMPASGLISSAGDPFHIGTLPFGVTGFNLDGQADNVQVWTRALNAAEITDLHCKEVLDPAAYPDLAMHYTLNDGAGATIAADLAGGIDGAVSGAVTWLATGATSCDSTASCSSAIAPLNPSHTDGLIGTLLTWDPLSQSVACRVQATRLVPIGGSPSVNAIGFEVSSFEVPYAAVGMGTTWEWAVKCACSLSPVDATSFSETDTFVVPALRTELLLDKQYKLFPNPASEVVTIKRGSLSTEATGNIRIINLMGNIITEVPMVYSEHLITLDISKLPIGMYFVQFEKQEMIPLEVMR